MRIFVLDDMEERLEFFRTWFADQDYAEAKTAHDAIEILKGTPKFDLYFLDHDLEAAHYTPGYVSSTWAGTGYDVVKFIVSELPEEKRPQTVVVHSWNPSGASLMRASLYEAGVPVVQAMFKPGGTPFVTVNG